VDDLRYRIRFTPRKPGSNWSAVNIERAQALQKRGRMKAAGKAAFAQRKESKSRTASYEQKREIAFSAIEIRTFKGNAGAWKYFEALPPSYRKKATWWIISAKQAETRARRLSSFIKACSEERRL
ncbi:MAG TPA: YdeI/OmpD-associated family protein, partial [Gammaproteobacteria bacterium]|nr:YdeI/OmpD-associated family protein [Gammaproteobacteria bacterium]